MPDFLERNMKGSDGVRRRATYPVYTVAEAEEMGITDRLPLDKVTEAGQWVETGDGYVAQAVRVLGPYGSRAGGPPRYEVVLPFCRAFTSSRKLEYLPFKETGVYCWSTPQRNMEREVKTARFKRAIKRYAFLFLTQQGVLSEEQMQEVGRSYREDQKNPGVTFKRLLKTYEAKKVLKKELKALMEEHGITPGHVVRQHQAIIDEAMQSGQLQVAEKANGRFIEMLGLMPDKNTQVSTTMVGGVSWGHLGEGSEPAQLAEHEVEQ